MVVKGVPPEAAESFSKLLAACAQRFAEELGGEHGKEAPNTKGFDDRAPKPDVEYDSEDEEGKYPFVVNHYKKGKGATLHRRDGCWHARELSFSSYQLFDVKGVPKGLYTSICKKCWPDTAQAMTRSMMRSRTSPSSHMA